LIGLLLKVFQASLKVGEGAGGLSSDLGVRPALMTVTQIVQGGGRVSELNFSSNVFESDLYFSLSFLQTLI
jgi:hypothetical protein